MFLVFLFYSTKFYINSVYMSKLFIFNLSFSFRYCLLRHYFLFLSISSIKSLTSISLLSFKLFMALGPYGMSKTKYKMGTCLSGSKCLLNISVKR